MAVYATNVDNVKIHLGDTVVDSKIQPFINSVSLRIEKYLDRYLEQKSRQEKLNVVPGQKCFSLKGSPIVSISEIKINDDSEEILVLDEDITFNDHTVDIESNYIRSGIGRLLITAVGGMATSTENFISEFPDISEGAVRQVIKEYNRIQIIHKDQEAVQGASADYAKIAFDNDFKATLDSYRRVVF